MKEVEDEVERLRERESISGSKGEKGPGSAAAEEELKVRERKG